jgi:putative PIN family toxin of toxin-antitoxin system
MNNRAVFDCMVYLQSAATPQRSHGLFQAARSGQVSLFISPDILSEVRDVLLRPKIVRHFPALNVNVVTAFLLDILSFAILIPEVPSSFAYPRDPKDEKYLNLAIAVAARYLVSADNDLLDLINPSLPDGGKFRTEHPRHYYPKAR